ncbi:MAG: YIP1 family protein [Candidatus Micrarchaeota archaeon]
MARIAQRADLWMQVASDPKTALEAESKRGNFEEGAKHLLLGCAVFSLLYASTFTLLPGMPTAAKPLNLAQIALFTIVNTLVASAAVALIAAMNYAAARAFGGKGRFAAHFYLNAVVTAPALVLFYAAKLFPGIGTLLSFAVLAFFVYLSFISIAIVHRFSGAKAFASLFLPSVFVLLVLAALGVTTRAAGI